MNIREAKTTIVRHGADAGGSVGFLQMFRPFRGLRERDFHELVEAIRIAAPLLRTDQNMDPEVVASLWSILVYTHAYALAPDCSLQQNHLISPAETARVHAWMRTIGFLVSGIQAGGEVDLVFESYDQEHPKRP